MTFIDDHSTVEPRQQRLLATFEELQSGLLAMARNGELPAGSGESLLSFGRQCLLLPINLSDECREIAGWLLKTSASPAKLADCVLNLLESVRISVRFGRGFAEAALSKAEALGAEVLEFLQPKLVAPQADGVRARALEEMAPLEQRPITGEKLIERLSNPGSEEPETLEILIRLAQQRLSAGCLFLSVAQQSAVVTALERIRDNAAIHTLPRSRAREVLVES